MDEMEIHAESRVGVTETDSHERDLAALVKTLVGVTARVTIKPPGSIERSMGKARRVIDTRPKN